VAALIDHVLAIHETAVPVLNHNSLTILGAAVTDLNQHMLVIPGAAVPALSHYLLTIRWRMELLYQILVTIS
jgi:hypothetical protein